MIKVGLVDDYRVDLEKLHAIVGRMDAVDIVFVTQSAEEAYEKVKQGDRWNFFDAVTASNKRLRKWDKENPNPLSWEEYTRLEAEFDAQYIKLDYS